MYIWEDTFDKNILIMSDLFISSLLGSVKEQISKKCYVLVDAAQIPFEDIKSFHNLVNTSSRNKSIEVCAFIDALKKTSSSLPFPYKRGDYKVIGGQSADVLISIFISDKILENTTDDCEFIIVGNDKGLHENIHLANQYGFKCQIMKSFLDISRYLNIVKTHVLIDASTISLKNVHKIYREYNDKYDLSVFLPKGNQSSFDNCFVDYALTNHYQSLEFKIVFRTREIIKTKPSNEVVYIYVVSSTDTLGELELDLNKNENVKACIVHNIKNLPF